MTDGTGALAGATAVIVLTGTSSGSGAIGDVFTMSGTLTTGGDQPPVAFVTSECDGEVGLIVVGISDDADFTYDIMIDGELIDPEVSVDGDEDLVYEVPEDGTYVVDVGWIEGEELIAFDETVTLECAQAPADPAAPVPAGPAAVAVVADPEFTG